MKKIVSFGDSFILGNEVHDLADGTMTWPGLISTRLGIPYHTLAVAGVGNEHIAQQVYDYFFQNPERNVLAVINWTWSMRWDVFLDEQQTWVNLGPTCVPKKLQGILDPAKADDLIEFYKRNIEPNKVWNRYRSLQAIWGVQAFLDSLGVKSVQTFMDHDLWCDGPPVLEHYDANRAESWPVITDEKDLETLPHHIKTEINQLYLKLSMPPYIKNLQRLVKPQMRSFDGDTFLDWSYKKGFKVTDLLHPLQEAHVAAADYWQKHYENLLT